VRRRENSDEEEEGQRRKDIPTVSLAEAAVSCPVSIPAASFFPTFMFN
jgi:hypothetical protein